MSELGDLRQIAAGLDSTAASLILLRRDVDEMKTDVHELRTLYGRLDEAIRGNGQIGLAEKARQQHESLSRHSARMKQIETDLERVSSRCGGFASLADLVAVKKIAEDAASAAALKTVTVTSGVELSKAKLAALVSLITVVATILASLIAKGGK